MVRVKTAAGSRSVGKGMNKYTTQQIKSIDNCIMVFKRTDSNSNKQKKNKKLQNQSYVRLYIDNT